MTASAANIGKRPHNRPPSRRTHGQTGTRLFRIWTRMRERCNQPSCAAFPRYGGRGITICDDWLGFVAFQRWALANGYADSLTIDRIDNDGIYEPDNCRWADAKTQARNTSRNPLFSYHGKTASLAEHAEDAGMPLSAVWQRVARLGWSIDKAMETPVRQMNRSMA